jgi:thioredoxin reductase (NADPH)
VRGTRPVADALGQRDVKVLTGADTTETRSALETSRRGVFAIGDVRSGSVKRVAAAVGEGAQVVATLHAALSAVGRDQSGIVRQ